MALLFTFAAFDWLMSLNPLWFSTIFGVYFFGGSFVSIFAVLAIAAYRARGKNLFGDFVSVEHIHNVGKLMLSFTAFWGYIAFSQFMLIWVANLPEEIPFFIVRFKTDWAALGVVLIFGHFFIPFGALLSRSLKRDRRKLALVAVWILAIHYVDVYWLVVPTLSPRSLDVPLDQPHGVPGRRPAGGRVHRLAAARALLHSGQGSLPRRLTGVQAAMSSTTRTPPGGHDDDVDNALTSRR